MGKVSCLWGLLKGLWGENCKSALKFGGNNKVRISWVKFADVKVLVLYHWPPNWTTLPETHIELTSSYWNSHQGSHISDSSITCRNSAKVCHIWILNFIRILSNWKSQTSKSKNPGSHIIKLKCSISQLRHCCNHAGADQHAGWWPSAPAALPMLHQVQAAEQGARQQSHQQERQV